MRSATASESYRNGTVVDGVERAFQPRQLRIATVVACQKACLDHQDRGDGQRAHERRRHWSVLRAVSCRGVAFPPNVEVADLGGPGLDLAVHVSSADVVLLVDALRGAPPGTIEVHDLTAEGPSAPNVRLDTHAPGIRASIQTARLEAGKPGHARLIGLAGLSFEHGTHLSRRWGFAAFCFAHARSVSLCLRSLNACAQLLQFSDAGSFLRQEVDALSVRRSSVAIRLLCELVDALM